VAGVRVADLRGYSYDRRDVTARGLANVYAQTLGSIFTETSKPYEVEIVVAEVGDSAAEDQVYRLTYDGSVQDEQGYVMMGGQAESLSKGLGEGYREGMTLAEGLGLAVEVLGRDSQGGASRRLAPEQLEVAVLERRRPRRTFRRIVGAQLTRLLAGGPDAGDTNGGATAPPVPATPDDPGAAPTSLAGGAHEPGGPEAPGASV
jgi:proteasome alpha subunit